MDRDELICALFDAAHTRFDLYLKSKKQYGEDDLATLAQYFAYSAFVEFFCDTGLDLAFFDSDNPLIM